MTKNYLPTEILYRTISARPTCIYTCNEWNDFLCYQFIIHLSSMWYYNCLAKIWNKLFTIYAHVLYTKTDTIFHYRDILKVTKVSQLKFVATEDLVQIGLSKPEQRRYKKNYTKYFPNPYISKIKKLLSSKRNEAVS